MSHPRTVPSLTGQELATLRRAAGLTQTQLAQAAGVGRHAVSYWETKAVVDPRGWAPKRMFEVLGIKVVPPVVPQSETISRGRARARHGMLPSLDRYVAEAMAREEARLIAKKRTTQARLVARTRATQERLTAREKAAQARRRVPCGAVTRKGVPCRMLSVPGRKRCKLHGGMSTGPRTAAGRARIAEARRRRWGKREPLEAGSGSSLRRRSPEYRPTGSRARDEYRGQSVSLDVPLAPGDQRICLPVTGFRSRVVPVMAHGPAWGNTWRAA
jgi:transcriptional regulator with XRE-family HTH domain